MALTTSKQTVHHIEAKMASDSTAVEQDWDDQIGGLLTELSEVQREVLNVLEQKRTAMLGDDLDALEELQVREAALGESLTRCHQRREQLLAAAQEAGLPSKNLGSLAGSLTAGKRGDLQKRVQQTSHQMRLLQHSSLTNWVATQRTLIHLTQMLEMIASGGRLKPTYGDSNAGSAGGALVDREV